ncbi:AraC family transcriptional regulator [Segnochrobactraceae bacterium EtOH-i3]
MMAEPALDRHLYVLGDLSAHVGFLNCERIAERRHIHAWHVAPHYHEGLTQVFCFASGRVRGQIDYETVDLPGPTVVWMPALVGHGFLYPPDIDGWVVTVATTVIARLLASMPWIGAWPQRAAVLEGKAHAAELARLVDLFRMIENDHGRAGEERDGALEALTRLVLVEMHRALRDADSRQEGQPDRRFHLVRRFQMLVDRDFARQRTVGDYAAELSVTLTHLSRSVKALTGRTAGEVVHDRLVLEARRLLAFSSQPIAAIAYQLNFSSPTYFTRFFVNRTRETPSEFRLRLRTAAEDVRAELARGAVPAGQLGAGG